MEKKPRICLWFSFLFIINFGWISRIIQDQTERMLGKEMNPKIFLWSYIDKVHYSGIKYCIQIVLYIKKQNTCVGLCTRNKTEYVFQKGSKKTFTPSANLSCIYFHWKHRLCDIRVHMDDKQGLTVFIRTYCTSIVQCPFYPLMCELTGCL